MLTNHSSHSRNISWSGWKPLSSGPAPQCSGPWTIVSLRCCWCWYLRFLKVWALPGTLLTLLTLLTLGINFLEVWCYCGWLRNHIPNHYWMAETLFEWLEMGCENVVTWCGMFFPPLPHHYGMVLPHLYHLFFTTTCHYHHCGFLGLRGDRRSAQGGARHRGGRPGASLGACRWIPLDGFGWVLGWTLEISWRGNDMWKWYVELVPVVLNLPEL